MSNVGIYFEKVNKRYKQRVEIKYKDYKERQLGVIPMVLKDLYNEVVSVKLPFGRIYSIEEAIEYSNSNQLFNTGWFLFGENNEGDKWLCLYKPDNKGRLFNVCSLDSQFPYPLYNDLIELLEDERYDFEEDLWNELLFDKNCII